MSESRPLLAVAPMIDITNKFFRFFMRLLTRKTTLYTEMLVDNTVMSCDPDHVKMASPHEIEHPVVVQLGGCNPETLSAAAQRCQQFGYDEINLNCGCPSNKVADGSFGAVLMRNPEVVREACAAMIRTVNIPVTVKCRLGCDDFDSYEHVTNFIQTVHQSGVNHFIIHARKCILAGLTPSQNRSIPPLNYEWVYQLQKDFPDLKFSINGGINTVDMINEHLDRGIYGVMCGRLAYNNPWLFSNADSLFYNTPDPGKSRREVLQEYAEYCQSHMGPGSKYLNHSYLSKPLTNLFNGCYGNTFYRRRMNQLMRDKSYIGNYQGMIETVIRELETTSPESLDNISTKHLNTALTN